MIYNFLCYPISKLISYLLYIIMQECIIYDNARLSTPVFLMEMEVKVEVKVKVEVEVKLEVEMEVEMEMEVEIESMIRVVNLVFSSLVYPLYDILYINCK